MFRNRLTLLALPLGLALMLMATPARAAIDMDVVPRVIVNNAPVSDCSAKAKQALNTVLQGAFEAGAGTGQWLAYGQPDSAGRSAMSAAIHCYPLDKGYVVTFTCGVQTGYATMTAEDLCTKLTAAFNITETASGQGQ